jgi:hypothetical protein
MTREQRAVIATLKRARKLISKPERWTKGASCRDGHGIMIYRVDSSDAVSFCAVGAIGRASIETRTSDGDIGHLALKALRGRLDRISAWNDRTTTTHEMVLARFDRTIARLEGAQ